MYCVDGMHLSSFPQVEAYWQVHYPRQTGSVVMNPKCGHQLVNIEGLPCSKEKTCSYTKFTQDIISEFLVAKNSGGCCGS